MFLKISQNSQKSTCARVSFLIELQAQGLQLYEKDSGTCVFKWILWNFQEHLFTEHLWTTAFLKVGSNKPKLRCYVYSVCRISVESHKKKKYLDGCDEKCSYYAVTKDRINKKVMYQRSNLSAKVNGLTLLSLGYFRPV